MKLSTVKAILYFGLFLVVVSGLGLLSSRIFSNEAVRQFVVALGIWGPLFLILGVAAAGIFVPMTSLPFLLGGLTLYGFWPTFIIFYLGNTLIAPTIDFWIARRYGRPAVAKLAGSRALAEIDKFAALTGWKALLILRLFGGVFFDSVSYAVGLTQVSFKTVLLITALAPLPGMLLTLKVLERGVTTSLWYVVGLGFWGYAIGLASPYVIYRLKRGRQAL